MAAHADPTEAIRKAALRMLGRRAYACGELADRLAAKGHDATLVQRVVRRLAECGLLDDEAYARELAEATIEKKPGSAALIRQTLEARRVPPEIAERVADEVLAGVDPVEAAAGLARALQAGGRGSPRARRQRIGAALSRRGFDADIIFAALERAGLPEEPYDEEHGP